MGILGKALSQVRHLKICLIIGFALFAELKKKVLDDLDKNQQIVLGYYAKLKIPLYHALRIWYNFLLKDKYGH